jgi:hypothetical protein
MPQEMPTVPVNFVPAKAGDIIKLGKITCRVMEDGSRTGKRHYRYASGTTYANSHLVDNRIGCAEFTLPPGTDGPPAHWHEVRRNLKSNKHNELLRNQDQVSLTDCSSYIDARRNVPDQ